MNFNPSIMQIFLIFHFSPLSRDLLFCYPAGFVLLCFSILFCPVVVLYKNRGTDKFIKNRRLFIDFSPCSTMQHIHSMTATVIAYVWDYPQSRQSALCHLPLHSADGCLSFISILSTLGLVDFTTAAGVARHSSYFSATQKQKQPD